MPAAERFKAKIKLGDLFRGTPCWVWQGKPKDGYGRISVEGKIMYTHRYAFLVEFGWLPEQPYELDHLCRVKLCCNPFHLEAVTHTENVRRGEQAIPSLLKRLREAVPLAG